MRHKRVPVLPASVENDMTYYVPAGTDTFDIVSVSGTGIVRRNGGKTSGVSEQFVTSTIDLALGVDAVAAEPIVDGAPVYIDSIGRFRMASAATYNTARVAGLASAATEAAFNCRAQRLIMQMPDWSEIAGNEELSIGSVYFLSSTPGQITVSPPEITGQCVTRIGYAISTSTLALQIDMPIPL